MAEKQTVYKIRVDGDDDLVRAGDRIEQRWSSVGKKLKEGVGGAVSSVAQGMLGLVNDSIRVATAVNTINLGQLVQDTKKLELSYTRFAVGTGKSLEQAKRDAEELGKKLLLDPGDVVEATKAYNKLTYQVRTTDKDLEALNATALSQGQELGDVLPLGVLLKKAGGDAVNMQEELGRIADAADKLGYSGGPKALQDTLLAAGSALDHVSLSSEEARKNVIAFLGALTKGLPADQQKRVASSISSQVYQRAESISRTIGYDILDPKTGKVKDIGKVLRDLRSRALRVYGTGGALKVLRREFGAEEGTALLNYDDVAAQKAEEASAATDAGQAGPKAAADLADSEAGKREEARIERERKVRKSVGGPLGELQHSFGELFKDSPILGQVATLALQGAGTAATGFLGSKLALRGAAGTAVRGAGGLAAATEGAAAATEGVYATGAGAAQVAQAELLGAEAFGKLSLTSRLPAVGLGGIATGAVVASGAHLAAYAALKDRDKEDRQKDLRDTAAKEIAGRVARGAASGQYPDIYAAAPDIARLAQNAGVGKSGDLEDTLRQVLKILAESKQHGVSSEFQNSVKNAFKDALRESGATVTPGQNPAREKTQKASASGEGAT